ncbi:MAG: helicase HerA-like domain-containing protein [Planctomycetota bacterium]|jgi:ribosomal protein S25
MHIGFDRDTEAPVNLDPKSLLRHMMALGSSGSGKTVLSKVLTEEFLLSGLPAIAIDPQGDLCSLVLHADNPDLLREKGLDPDLAQELHDKLDPVIFTPGSRKGIGISSDPISGDIDGLKKRDRVFAITGMATMLVSLLGYDLDSDDGAGMVAVFDSALTHMQQRRNFPRKLDHFTRWFTNLDDDGLAEFDRFLDTRKIAQACKKLARLDVGARRMMFHEGLSLNIDLMLGKGDNAAAVPGKPRLSIVYLNTLNGQEDKEFFIAALAERLYSWMLQNPSKEPQALFYIDEVAPFIPPVRKPACKPPLSLIFKQARKYGVCCLMATQNPADVDYKAMAQFGTWAIGRLTTRQDMKKVQPTVKSLAPVEVDNIMEQLPSQQPGEFVLLSPDNFKDPIKLRTRWLFSKHETFDDDTIERVTSGWREKFLDLENRLAQVDEPVVESLQAIAETSGKEEATKAKRKPEKQADNSDTVLDDEELVRFEKKLRTKPSMTAAEFAKVTKLSEGKARSRLRKLETAKLARSFKRGRSIAYYSLSSGLRPDLGLDSPITVLAYRITNSDAMRLGQQKRSRKMLGVFGDDEELQGVELEYRLAWRVSFREKVTRMFIKRIFGGGRYDEYMEFVYLHPESMKIVVFSTDDGISLVEKPEDRASRIDDFDGVTTMEERPPALVKIHESDFKRSKDSQTVATSLKRRYDVTVKKVEPVLFPVWNLKFSTHGKSGARVAVIDAISGKPVEW